MPVPRFLLRPGLRADQGHEADVPQVLAREAAVGLTGDAHELLERAPLADRHHQPASRSELVQERAGHAGRAGGDDDRVERGALRPAERAVAVPDRHVRHAELAEAIRRQIRQVLVTFDRVDASRDPAEDRRRVP
jgi:hypothetical protein